MGVTIHFEGRLRSETDYEACIETIQRFAEEHGWPVETIPVAQRTLARVQNEENWDYTGKTRGIEVHPHANAEPFRFEVDEHLFFQEYCKTQFAPVETHIGIVELLRELSDRFTSFSVVDEGEYFESSDVERLTDLRQGCFTALKELLQKHPDSQGPVRLESGRIADIIS